MTMFLVHALICCSALISWMHDTAEGHDLLAGILLPITGPLPVDRSLESVVNSTVRDINRYLTLGRVPFGNISALDASIMDVHCDPVATVKAILELALDGNRTVDVFIGPACENVCPVAALLAGQLNIPMVSYGCSSSVLSDKTEFPTFARSCGSNADIPDMIKHLLTYFRLTQITLISTTEHAWMTFADEIKVRICNDGVTVNSIRIEKTRNEGTWMTSYINALSRTTSESQVIIILLDRWRLAGFMRAAKRSNLLDGNHVFLSINSLTSSFNITPEMEGLLDIRFRHPDDSNKNRTSSGNVTSYYNTPSSIGAKDVQAAFLHDAIWMYVQSLNQTLSENDPGGFQSDEFRKRISANFRNKTFKGMMGEFETDQNGNPINRKYSLTNIQKGRVVSIFDYEKQDQRGSASLFAIQRASVVYWPGSKIEMLTDISNCDGNWEMCHQGSYTQLGRIIGIVVGVFVIALLSWAIRTMIKVRKRAQDTKNRSWKIDFDSIQFHLNQSVRFSSCSSIMTTNLSDDIHANDSESMCQSLDGKSMHRPILPLAPYQSIGSIPPVKHIKQGFCKENVPVAVKLVRKPYVCLTKEIVKEIQMIKTFDHPNLNEVFGVCTNSNHVSIVSKFCSKGSLRDVLDNEALKLDKSFKLSFATDIVQGMIYLHESPIKYHGQLKSTNVLVNSRWTCCISDYGLRKFREGEKPLYPPTDPNYYYELLWTAPEHLRQDESSRTGSEKGDVYSFAIILQEIVQHTTPWGETPDGAREVIQKLVRPVNAPHYFRPVMLPGVVDNDFYGLMTTCWDERPFLRSAFSTVKSHLRMMNKGKTTNLVDHMMEHYASQLEELVRERTSQLDEERHKTENLLYQMLPKSVADQLKSDSENHVVRTCSYEAVTIYFSDIVGFTSLAADSTPEQIVCFLNDLYTEFDQTIENYNVYKVETIGDSYMVAGGLPEPNEHHAGHICTMALDILSLVTNFEIKHRPNQQLQLRLGIHSGPVAAGVVGVKMPRYCLFGETVNYASRMESNGLALRIHVSSECKKYLDAIGGFKLEERGIIEIKGLGKRRTYWLTGKDGFDKPLPDLRLAASLEEHEFK